MTSSVEIVARLAAIVELQKEILGSLTDPESVGNIIVGRTAEITSGTGALITILRDEDLICQAESGSAVGHIGFHLPIEASLSGHAIRDRKVMRCNNTEVDARVDPEACRAMNVHSLIVAPLFDGDDALGTLCSLSTETDAFDDLDTHMLEILAGISASAIVRARSLREHQSAEERYRMLFDKNVAGVFRSTLSGRILDCNDSLVQYLGYDSRDDLLMKEAWDLYRDREDRQALLEEMHRHRAVRNARVHFRKKDGTPMIGVMNISTIPGETGEEQLLGTLVEE